MKNWGKVRLIANEYFEMHTILITMHDVQELLEWYTEDYLKKMKAILMLPLKLSRVSNYYKFLFDMFSLAQNFLLFRLLRF